MSTYINRENDFSNQLSATEMSAEHTHPQDASINTIRNRADNCTSLSELEVQIDKGGLIRDYQKCVYTHILRELLGDAANKETLVALDEYGITSLPKLLELIRTPGSIIGLRYNGEMLREDQYERLLALYSYLNWLQMVYGPIADGVFNIFRASRSHFDWFIWEVYDVSNPIIYSEDGELLNHQYSIDSRRLLRRRFGYEEDLPNIYYDTVNPNSDHPTPTAYDNKMWHCNYFRNTLSVMGNYPSSNHDLYWNEIDWPSRNNDNNNHYITRVLSQPLTAIIKYRNDGMCNDGWCAATKIQHVWRGYILRLHFTRLHDTVNIIQRIWKGSHARGKLTTAERILINTGGDKDHVDLYRGLRMKKKGIRCSVSQNVTGSRRRYAEALVIALPSAIVIQRYVRRFFAIKLVSKLKESVCCDPPITYNAPSHTSGLSQSSMPTKELLPEVVSMNDGENGETLDGSSGLVDILQDTTMYTALKDIPTWGGRMNQSYTGYNKSDPNKKSEEEWGSLLDWPVCYDDIQEDTVKDWQWIDLMTRKFASRGKFADQEVMPYDSLLIVMLLASSITTL